MTAANTFYIFPFQSVEANDGTGSLLLVHCLAQLDNPHSKEHWIQHLLKMSSWVGLNNHQNAEHENYYHPITHLMKLMGKQHRVVKHLVASVT